MQALHASDADKLASLAGSSATTGDAKDLLSRWSGVSSTGYSTTYTSDVDPSHMTVAVATTDKDNASTTVQFPIIWREGKWILGIGHTVSPSGASQPANSSP